MFYLSKKGPVLVKRFVKKNARKNLYVMGSSGQVIGHLAEGRDESNAKKSTHVGGHLDGCCDEKHTHRDKYRNRKEGYLLTEVTQVYKDCLDIFSVASGNVRWLVMCVSCVVTRRKM